MNKPGARPTLATIAAELGVSTASVSNALKRPERVSADLRLRVLEAATRVGYAGPAAVTRLLPGGKSDSVAVLFTAELPAALRDPAAVAFLGYDDVAASAAAGLTTVAQPHVVKGRTAGELFVDRRGVKCRPAQAASHSSAD